MKIFIAGATGVLGRRVVKGLVAKAHTVVGLSRSKKNAQWLAENGAQSFDGDLFDAASMKQGAKGCDVVMHLATSIPTALKTGPEDWAVNDRIRREGTKNLIDAVLANDCKLYVQQSVSFVYGDRKGAVVDESSRLDKDASETLQSAVDLEHLVEKASAKQKLPAVVLRCGHFYGADCVHTQKMLHLIKKGSFAKVAGGEVYWNNLHIDDAASAFVAAVESADVARGQILNVTDNHPVLFAEIVDFMADELGVKHPGSVPAFLAKIAVGKLSVDFSLMSMKVKAQKVREILKWSPKYPTYREGYHAVIAEWRG